MPDPLLDTLPFDLERLDFNIDASTEKKPRPRDGVVKGAAERTIHANEVQYGMGHTRRSRTADVW